MHPCVLNLCSICHDPHSLPQHPSPSLPPQNRRACPPSKLILIGISQNRQEMQFSAKDRAREGGYGEEVGRQGHPPNFVGSSIEGEHKFGGWICQRWVPSLADATPKNPNAATAKTPLPAPKNTIATTTKNPIDCARKHHCLSTRWGRGPMPTHVSFGNSRV